MPTGKEIRKVKFNGERVVIHYAVATGDERETLMTLTSEDLPEPEFGEALQGLREVVCDIMEVPRNYADEMAVTGVSIRDQDNGLLVGITALRKVSSCQAPMVLNTPMSGFSRSTTWYDAVRSVEEQAYRYMNGHRAQGVFDFGSEVMAGPTTRLYEAMEGSGLALVGESAN